MKIFGEAVQDPVLNKWGWSITDENGIDIVNVECIFDSKETAESQLISMLKELGKFAESQKLR